MKPEGSDFFIGLDLGQKRDFSALAAVERIRGLVPCYDLRHIERLSLNLPYPAVAGRARDLVASIARHGHTKLVIDGTGVGAPVLDLLHAYGVLPIAVTITGGHSVSGMGLHFRVPKRTLMRTLVALFGAGRIRFAAGIPHSAELVEELLSLRVKINRRTRQESYGAKGAQKHDDLVLALALAVWYAEHAWEAAPQRVGFPACG